MRRHIVAITGVALLLGALLGSGAPREAAAGVDVGVSVNLGPPPIVVPAPPALVLVPNSQVYFVPGVAFDVFFYNGYWWSPRGDRWYRARVYDGPWRVIERRYVPAPIYRVPGDYRARFARERHIPYGQWKREWRHHEGRGGYYDGHRDQGRPHGRDDYRDHGDHGDHGGPGEHGHGHGR